MTLLYDKSYTSVADEGGLYLPSFNLGKTEESITVADCFQIVDNFYLSGEAIKGELHVGDEVYVQFSDGRVVSGQVTYMQIYRESVEVVNTGESAGVVISGITREDSDFLRPSVIITKQ